MRIRQLLLGAGRRRHGARLPAASRRRATPREGRARLRIPRRAHARDVGTRAVSVSEVLVVHAIDAEGPLGGDARRRPDGSHEFFDDWSDIKRSLEELTLPDFRESHPDSFGGPYRFNWFVLDFTGFRTNPKNRVASYHDTYDHVRSLPVEVDGLYWHYHPPPATGIGDHWAESWLESNEHNMILARRLLERRDFPEAFRAGGTIEDEAGSRWLEEVFLLDFSNRVSERDRKSTRLNSSHG